MPPTMGSPSYSPPPRSLLGLLLLLLVSMQHEECHVAAQTGTPGKSGTLVKDKIGLHALWRAFDRPANIAEVWMGEDPCGVVASGAAGLTCGQLETPVVGNGQTSWFFVQKIQLTKNSPQRQDFNIGGSIDGSAFTNGQLANLEILDLSYNHLVGSIPSEISSLTKLSFLALNNNQLNGTIPTEITTLPYLDVLWLGANNLTGALPPSLPALAPTLKSLKAHRIQLSGGIPSTVGSLTRLVQLDLSYNSLSLDLPPVLSQLTNLTTLYLHNNYLTGSLPSWISSLTSLDILKLSHNLLTGSLPMELSTLTNLKQLILDNNQFSGTIPTFLADMQVLVLSLQSNNFTGTVGAPFNKWPVGFIGNQQLCSDFTGSGYQPCQCTGDVQGKQMCDPLSGPGPCVCPQGSLPAAEGHLPVGWTIFIALGGALVLLGLIALLYWGYRTNFGRKKGGGWEYAGKIRSFPDVRAYRSQAYDPDEIDGYGIQAYDPTPTSGSGRNSLSGFDTGLGSAAGSNASTPSSTTAAAFARKFGRSLNNQLTMRQFSYDELQLATNNFSPDNIVSTDNGVRKTYSGVLPSGTYIAVKELDGPSSEPVEAFAAAVEVFSLVRCPQLVEVLGFSCSRGGSRLLVYELLPNGSLDLHLHDLDSGSPALDWNTRMSISLQVAKALAYLHSMSPQMVHQNLQASAVLLNDSLQAKVADYCLGSLRPLHGSQPYTSSTNVAVAAGTAAPELAWSSQPTPRTDVYAFGVLLLEIISGRRPIDSHRPPNEQSLVRWVKPRLTERSQVEGTVDKKLRGNFSSAALYQVALLASQCIQTDPEARPSMVQAVEVLQNVQGLPMDNSLSGKKS